MGRSCVLCTAQDLTPPEPGDRGNARAERDGDGQDGALTDALKDGQVLCFVHGAGPDSATRFAHGARSKRRALAAHEARPDPMLRCSNSLLCNNIDINCSGDLGCSAIEEIDNYRAASTVWKKCESNSIRPTNFYAVCFQGPKAGANKPTYDAH
jgi:hypothetical protein